MEIERKYLIKTLPANLEQYPKTNIEQGYLCMNPTLRIRKKGDDYIFTYKSRQQESEHIQTCVNQEIELPLTKEAYEHLCKKTDGILVRKTRYCIPYGPYTIELDLFKAPYEDLQLAEVEFPTTEEAEQFSPPEWFGENVSGDFHYSNVFFATDIIKKK